MTAADWRKTLRLIPGYDPFRDAAGFTFDADRADRACEFFPRMLRHVEGHLAGRPLVLEPWQLAIVGNLFGWIDGDGLRRYRECLVYVPRKNGKTTMIAGLCNYVLFCDGEPGAQIYSAAADRDQASLVFRQARGMVLQNPELERRSKIYDSHRSIEYGSSVYRVISADANTKHGFNSHLVVIDELHAQPNRDLVDVLVTSTGARRQPLIVYTTTADFERPSICNEKHDYAERVQAGTVEDARFLPVLYEAGLDADWAARKVWEECNPNLGVSVSYQNMEADCLRAQELTSYENTFRRLRLNTRTQQDVRWLQIPRWDDCAEDGPALEGRECYGGLDMSSTTDLTALALVFPGDGVAHLRAWFWAPAESARIRERRDRAPYLAWAKDGWLTLTEGDTVDYDRVRADVLELHERYNIRAVAIDRWASTQITNQLSGDGIDMVPFGQGFGSMSAPSKEFERMTLNRTLLHNGNAVLRWMVGHVAVQTDAAGCIKPSKKKSTERIDGIVASVMALGVWVMKDKEAGGPSVYDKRGILFL